MTDRQAILAALQNFASAVTAKMSQLTAGEPEDQLRGPFENFMQEAGKSLGLRVVCTGETLLPNRLGRPDYAVHINKLLAGYVELKAPGVGANAKHFSGHNRAQWKRFSAIPNILYTDGNEWALYRGGELVNKMVRLSGDVSADGKKAATPPDDLAIERILNEFLRWEPYIPTDRNNRIDLKGFAELLAPLCRMLRDDVIDALKNPSSPLVELAKDWRQLLFPDATDAQFADAYAQTVTFALLLGRSEGANPLTLASAEAALAAQHNLLSRALQVLTDQGTRSARGQGQRDEMTDSLDLLVRVIDKVPPATLSGPEDPWLNFYEDFLAAYDPNLRKQTGAYYTPVEVVRAQVRLVDDLLTRRLGKSSGFSTSDVVTLDPAAGTGTYLLGVIEHAIDKVKSPQGEGEGAVPGKASILAANLYGFEMMVGPYTVAELRVTRALRDHGAQLPEKGTHLYLTDTLESPHAVPQQRPLFLKPIAEQHAEALRVKSKVPVIVCLGNPPYGRHEAVSTDDMKNLNKFGGWVRFGDELPDNNIRDKKGRLLKLKKPKAIINAREKLSILYSAFVKPAREAGHGGDLKNIYNLYIYFWRWALWKVFEHENSSGPGIVSFISASSFLNGDAFCGMREHMRRLCDEIWIIDLGGEGRGTRQSDNVFTIQTPVAITVAVRYSQAGTKRSAKVHYARIEGSREDKLARLGAIKNFKGVSWEDCPADPQAAFRPVGDGEYSRWPLLSDLFPWRHSGVELKRTWPVAPNQALLEARWRALLVAKNRAEAFRGSGDREIDGKYHLRLTDQADSRPISLLPLATPLPPVARYGYRSLDRQYLIADARLISRPRPPLWGSHGKKQIYLTSLFNHPLGSGPALMVSAEIPDRHYLRGSFGGKDVMPLYRDPEGREANLAPCILTTIGEAMGLKLSPEDFLAYIYGLMAQPAYAERFADELGGLEIRVPITKNIASFVKVGDVGRRLLWLHTYAQRLVPRGKHPGQLPKGQARCVKSVPGDPEGYPDNYEYNIASRKMRVGDGEFSPVAREVFEFEVSGLPVVPSWLKYRMKIGGGKKSSPLDYIPQERWTAEFTTELLELLWVLEATVAGYPEQAKLLEAVVKGPCFQANELPDVPDRFRKPPSRSTAAGLFDETETDGH